ncbi:MAG: hypothetical protein HXX16_06330 [Bacteroidales bacterium]|nr:hypothetical protein [Bacteroidales bacterium]
MEAVAVLQKSNSNQTGMEELEFKEYEDYDSDAIHFEPDYYTDRLDAELDERLSVDSNLESAQAQRNGGNTKFMAKNEWDDGDMDNEQIKSGAGTVFYYEDELAIEELKTLVGSPAVEFLL